MVWLTQLLVRMFVRDYQNIKDPDVRGRYGRMAGIVGIVCNLLLGGGKALAGLLFSSISVLADGINNLSDATSSVVTDVYKRQAKRLASILFSKKKKPRAVRLGFFDAASRLSGRKARVFCPRRPYLFSLLADTTNAGSSVFCRMAERAFGG